MSESIAETSVDNAAPVLTASEVLKQAREAIGLSREDIATELYLTPAVIRHIDENTMDQITKQAFVRGYLRSYARLVDVDGDEVVRLFDEHQGGNQQSIEIRGVTQEPVGSIKFTGPVFQTGAIGLVGLAVIILMVWMLTTSDDADEPAVVVGQSAPEAATAAPAPTLQLPGRSTGDPGAAVPAEADASPEGESATSATEPAQSGAASAPDRVNLQTGEASSERSRDQASTSEGQSEPQAQPTSRPSTSGNEQAGDETTALTTQDSQQRALESIRSDAPTTANSTGQQLPLVPAKDVAVTRNREGELNYIQVNAGGNDNLEFTFVDECWIEIEDAEGSSVYGDLNRAGDVLRIAGKAPFEILFGKAPAVTMSFNGEPVDLVPHTTSVQTAKVRVGE